LVLIQISGNRQIVTAVSPDAPPAVRPGISLAQARAHCSHLQCLDETPAEDWRSLEALARWLMRFSPNVALCPPSSIFLDAAGLERLLGNPRSLARRVAAALAQLGLAATVAIAPTPGAAWALAVFSTNPPLPVRRERVGVRAPLGNAEEDPHPSPLPEYRERGVCVVDDGNLMAALSALPPAALRLEPVVTLQLHALGVNTIGLLLKIPRKELAARFGPAILERIDQATGDVAEVLNWLPHRAPIRAQLEFDGAVESLEAIHLALRELLGPITEQLARRGLGAKELQMTFRPSHAPPVEKLIRLSRPSRGQMDLFSLIQHATQNLEIDEGIAAIGLFVSAASPLGDEQAALIGGEPQRNAAELDHLLERLRARLGEVAQWAQLVESHLPERAFRCDQSPAYPCGAADKEIFRCDQSPACTCGAADKEIFRWNQSPACTCGAGDKQIAARPLCLLPIPRRVQAIVRPSESRDGQPVSFTQSGQVHRLAYVKGPERIAGEWWNGRWKTRDYFDAQDDAGNRYWLFRVVQSGQWYLHGIFE